MCAGSEVGEQRGREGDDADRQEHQQIEDEYAVIRAAGHGKDSVVIDPDDADDKKAREKRQVRRPLVRQIVPPARRQLRRRPEP